MKLLTVLFLYSAVILTNITGQGYIVDQSNAVILAYGGSYSPIYLASYYGQIDVIERLIRNSADVNIRENGGFTPIHVAAQQGHERVVDLLLKNGANINLQTNYGQTPLHCATWNGHEKVVAVLVQNGANVNIQSNDRLTPLNLATIKGNARIVEILKKGQTMRKSDKACQLISHQKSATSKILGGNNAPPNTYIWMAALGQVYYNQYNNQQVFFFCGGTIISNKFILTAAHCLMKFDVNLIRLGTNKLIDSYHPSYDDYQVKSKFVHGSYSNETLKNDIALIEVTNNIQFSNKIGPACLETDVGDLPSHVNLIVTGWGNTKEGSFGGSSPSNDLKMAQLTTVPLSQCNAAILEHNKYASNAMTQNGLSYGQYCAQDRLERSDACGGDSGGPIQYFKDSSPVARVVGIVSFGVGCFSKELPGVYTRVASYLDWIEMIVWPNQF
ncbi:serine protease Hayan-like [Contarinia nasturtii]|uniref:serine protease Hayan-like n=1 Tax=Contarinia nasturtii TaxID=265458 RepID=UPI0012D454B7|nr:serine protease Hayan-like [Contarinia nasturtii]XP_031632021.1 serine protease Hayan-like [Contarinia nasturtii]